MQVHHSMNALPEIPFPVVTMGSFDGVHAGHRVIISRLNHLAKMAGGKSVLITFHPHPRKVLYPEGAGKELRLISTLDEKCGLLEEAGLDHLVIMSFSLEFSRTTSKDFVEKYLVGKLCAHTVVVGFNHFFGHNREGCFDSLYSAREKFGFRVEEIPEQEIQNETVSSTKIRKALLEGNIQRANAYLEHHFMIRGEEERCMIGEFNRPCFRIRVEDPIKLVPPIGSYAASVITSGGFSKALVKIEKRGIMVFPAEGSDDPVFGRHGIRFHKHLVFPNGTGLEREIEAVQELIY